ncbi:unnamed protein product [Polarella glacialis]|uniref:Uncharacterized protein n=1 Tax=Polarella glacialis TaxID=89957 RepID=A0A813IST5_POLGL|nr:unnamed protein product [Polarella glacialis]
MAAVKLIKFVAVTILASSSAAEPTNRTCAGQDQDVMVALQVGEQSHVGGCKCADVCPGYEDSGGNAHHFSCSNAKEAYLASDPPGVDLEAFSRATCEWTHTGHWGVYIYDTKCWTHTGTALTAIFHSDLDIWYTTHMAVVCPNGWCECRSGGCGCKAEHSGRYCN